MGSKMRCLVTGLGSMGKRRIRNLESIGGITMAGLDRRADRREEASARYGIQTFDDFYRSKSSYGLRFFSA